MKERRKWMKKTQGLLLEIPDGPEKELLEELHTTIVQIADRLETVKSAINYLADGRIHMAREMAKGIEFWENN